MFREADIMFLEVEYQRILNSVLFFFNFLISRLRELHTLKGHVESVVKLKGLDIETIQQHYTV